MIDMESISAGLRLASDGIWYPQGRRQNISYPDNGCARCFVVEDRSFWFQHRNRCIIALVRLFPPRDNRPIFDIGGGNGYVSQGLAREGFQVVLAEPQNDGACNAKKRGLQNIVCASLEDAQFLPGSLHAMGLFDVLEHVEDDISFLKMASSVLASGGRLYATVPGYQFLWSGEDVSAGHYRRYTLREIGEKLKMAAFEVDFATYIFRFLPIPIFFLRTIPYRLGFRKEGFKANSLHWDHAASGNKLRFFLDRLLSLEICNIQVKSSMGFGGTCLVAATRS